MEKIKDRIRDVLSRYDLKVQDIIKNSSYSRSIYYKNMNKYEGLCAKLTDFIEMLLDNGVSPDEVTFIIMGKNSPVDIKERINKSRLDK